MSEDRKPEASESEEPPAPSNRAERRALKKGKGANRVKGVGGENSKSGFNPKSIQVSANKDFSNRKSG